MSSIEFLHFTLSSLTHSLSGLNTIPLPPTRIQSFVGDSAAAGSEVTNNSSVLETRLVTGTHQSFNAHTYGSPSSDNSPATTCNGEPCHGVISTRRVMVDSDTDSKNKRENSIPNEVSILHKDTQEDQSHTGFSDSDMEYYWSNLDFSDFQIDSDLFKDIGILDEGVFDHPASTHAEGGV